MESEENKTPIAFDTLGESNVEQSVKKKSFMTFMSTLLVKNAGTTHNTAWPYAGGGMAIRALEAWPCGWRHGRTRNRGMAVRVEAWPYAH